MATRNAEMLDALGEECREILKCKDTLEALYSACGTTENAMKNLLRPHNPTGLDFSSVADQIQSLKDILDRQMQLVRLLFIDVQQCSDILQALTDANDPSMDDEVNRLENLLLAYCMELNDLIKRTVKTCKGFHHVCKIVFQYIKEIYSTLRE
ncbi:unnamed protein product [Larinioides sclopetarius]|uniref:Uncharacterized protein n=1 Tax=Larinioides sclopetarius TaxID=280406 RepID=A0AAV2BML2_9ARAC